MARVIAIRRATPSDVDVSGDVLARAFQDDGGTVLVEPDAERRRAVFPAFFRMFLAAGIAEGGDIVVPAERLTGVAMWFGPDRHGPSEESMVAHGLPAVLDQFGPDAAGRLGPMTAELEAQHDRLMREPHLRLDFFGVDPEFQGRGIGVALAEHGHRRADELRVPCYLETFSESNVRFYEHRGYRTIDTYVVGDGVPVYAMRREPRAAGAADG